MGRYIAEPIAEEMRPAICEHRIIDTENQECIAWCFAEQRAGLLAQALNRSDCIDRLWEHLDDIERACTHTDDAEATVNSIVRRIEALRSNLGPQGAT